MRILVVEDEVDLADAVARGLRREGYAVDVAYDGEEALAKLSLNAYDLFVLDVNLPGVNGHRVARGIRSAEVASGNGQSRILMLTALGDVEDRVAGLDVGADDYLVKPFAFDELAARVRALLRRGTGQAGAVLQAGALRLDARRHSATRNGQELDLTPKEFSLLRYFMAHHGEVLSQEELLEHVWDENADPFTKTVRVTIMNLRRKLGAAGGKDAIETVAGRGYRLTERA